ncbi:Clp protease N-terminal domain-containing protein [Kitasatospora sp. NBC_01302]|uniref:Clp protease N-terminal domain-containing protein n=1 Tax=Kitasatospora sp. NBC_01302 TaxID=2903575 RepID=UPI002E1194DE|nr:peptidase [Kitasatospora sp. NBC_01302]
MFDRFTPAARDAVSVAQWEATRLHHPYLGTEHLLLGLLHHPEDSSVAVLVELGLDLPTARAGVVRLLGDGTAGGDAEALGSIGIDLTAVREAVEAGFGRGALDGPASRPEKDKGPADGRVRFSDRAKKAVELSLRAALARKSKAITPGHLLLGVLQEAALGPTREQRQGLAARVLQDHGLAVTAVHAAVLATVDR